MYLQVGQQDKLIKSSNVDYDFEWMDVSSGGGDTVYYIPSTEGTASNPIILSEKPVGTYYITDINGNPTSIGTKYYKRTADTVRMSVENVLEFSVIESEVDGPLADGIIAGVFKLANSYYYTLSTKDDASGYRVSVLGGQLVNIKDNQTITGVKTFNNLPKSSVVPTEVDHFTNKDYVDNQLSNLISLIYPIGSIYMSAANTNPGVLFGGTWEEWGTGRVPVGIDTSDDDFNTVEKTGGSKFLQEHNHTATTNSTGSHTHKSRGYYTTPGGSTSRAMANAVISGDPLDNSSIQSAGAHTHTVTVANAGVGDSGNLQPYITCYMWKRVS